MSEPKIEQQNERMDRLKLENLALEAMKLCWMCNRAGFETQYVDAVQAWYDNTPEELLKGIPDMGDPETRQKINAGLVSLDDVFYVTEAMRRREREKATQKLLLIEAHKVFRQLLESHKQFGLLWNLGDISSGSTPDITKGELRGTTPDESAVPELVPR